MKKAQVQFGIVIIVMAGLLLLGGIFFDDGPNQSKKSYFLKKDQVKNSQGYIVDGYPEDSYLFYLNETDIGKQKKVTESFPNIELGSKIEYNTVYLGNSFRLNANPFNANRKQVSFQLSDPDEVRSLLVYFNPHRSSGEQELIIAANGIIISQNLAKSSDIPIKIYLNQIPLENSSKITLTFGLDKPDWFSLFNWNKMDVEEVRIVEIKKDENNNQKEFDFFVSKEFLEESYLDLTISCDEGKELGDAIKATVNGYIISNTNPKCTSRQNRITSNISTNILKDGANRLVLETDGYYKVAYGITKKYFNDQEVYKFNINSFNDIIDVVMYGDFDKDIIDVRINTQTISLRRDEIKSIVSYLRFGTNEIKFLTKPVEIEEFVIEKNEFLY